VVPTGGVFFLTPSGWTATLGAWGQASGQVQIPLVQATNLSGLVGTQIYVAYGCDLNEVLTNQRYARVYVIQ
jgi:hypothetical protein